MPGEVGPDALRRMAEQLKLLQGANVDQSLITDILKLKARNPGLSDRELAERLVREHPELGNPQRLEGLQQFLRQYGHPAGGGMPFVPPKVGEFPMGGGGPGVPPPQPIGPAEEMPPDRPRPPSPPRVSATPNENQPGGMFQPPPNVRRGPPFDLQNLEGGRFPSRLTPEEGGVSPETLERRQRQFQAMAGWWEKNVGPLNESPAVRQLLLEMFTGRNPTGEDTGSLGELLEGPAGEGFGKVADHLSGSKFKLPDLGLSKGWGGSSSFTPPPAPSGGSSLSNFGGFNGGTAGSWLPVVILMVLAALGLVLWWLWPKLVARGEAGPRPLPGLGPWPVDPRRIADREALVKAFEYLSVLVCGGGARVWNHVTIAAALERTVPQAEALAGPLARLYAVARYTPADEPLPPGAVAEARGYLCDLAGVSAP
jgi:hypothetical protein